MTPFERAMGEAIRAALSVTVEEANDYAREARARFESSKAILSPVMLAAMELGCECAESFAAFRAQLGDAGEKLPPLGVIG